MKAVIGARIENQPARSIDHPLTLLIDHMRKKENLVIEVKTVRNQNLEWKRIKEKMILAHKLIKRISNLFLGYLFQKLRQQENSVKRKVKSFKFKIRYLIDLKLKNRLQMVSVPLLLLDKERQNFKNQLKNNQFNQKRIPL